VGNVTDMTVMFGNAAAFNQDIGRWDVSEVKYMRYMFVSALAFNQDIGDWDVSKIESMDSMFSNATAFNKDISSWDVRNVVTINSMFAYATAFNQDIGDWNVSSVGDMIQMFTGVTLSTANYDAFLIGWAAQTVTDGVEFDGCNSQYCLGGQSKNILTGEYNWVIEYVNNMTDGWAFFR